MASKRQRRSLPTNSDDDAESAGPTAKGEMVAAEQTSSHQLVVEEETVVDVEVALGHSSDDAGETSALS
jgi:hypothetical protein